MRLCKKKKCDSKTDQTNSQSSRSYAFVVTFAHSNSRRKGPDDLSAKKISEMNKDIDEVNGLSTVMLQGISKRLTSGFPPYIR